MSQRNVQWIFGFGDGVSRRLIDHAARRAPAALSLRLQEEWFADLEARPPGLSRLRFAIGCCWASRAIALEYQPAVVAASSDIGKVKCMSVHVPPRLDLFSRRSATLCLVVSLHIALFYAVINNISHPPRSAVPTPLQNRLLDAPRPSALPVLLPDPLVKSPPIIIVPPVYDLPPERDPSQDVTTDADDPSVRLPPMASWPLPAHVANLVAGGPGVATVRVCVDVHGKLTSDPTTLQASGSSRLDEGALKLARAGSGHYRATTEDGLAVNSCYPLRIRFQLR